MLNEVPLRSKIYAIISIQIFAILAFETKLSTKANLSTNSFGFIPHFFKDIHYFITIIPLNNDRPILFRTTDS